MTIRETADALVRETQDMRWQNARDTIQQALEEQYRLGFLDGEAGVINDATPTTQTWGLGWPAEDLLPAVEGAAV